MYAAMRDCKQIAMFTSADSTRPRLTSRISLSKALAGARFFEPCERGSQHRAVTDAGANDRDEGAPIQMQGTSPLHIAAPHRSDAEWRQALADKDERFRDLHHRVKNSLQLLSSLLSIEIRNIKDPQAARHLRDIQHRMHVLVRVHERLSSEQDRSDYKVAVGTELKALCAELGQSFGALQQNLSLRIEMERCEVSAAKLAPLSLIVSELVANAIKHAVPTVPSRAPTNIVISLQRDRDAWARVSVSDSGPGLSPDFDPTRCPGLGMRLILSFARQIGGTLSTGRLGDGCGDAPRGACFTISFPVED
jgi:two-component sensor histidine kinase